MDDVASLFGIIFKHKMGDTHPSSGLGLLVPQVERPELAKLGS